MNVNKKILKNDKYRLFINLSKERMHGVKCRILS